MWPKGFWSTASSIIHTNRWPEASESFVRPPTLPLCIRLLSRRQRWVLHHAGLGPESRDDQRSPASIGRCLLPDAGLTMPLRLATLRTTVEVRYSSNTSFDETTPSCVTSFPEVRCPGSALSCRLPLISWSRPAQTARDAAFTDCVQACCIDGFFALLYMLGVYINEAITISSAQDMYFGVKRRDLETATPGKRP